MEDFIRKTHMTDEQAQALRELAEELDLVFVGNADPDAVMRDS